MIATTAVDRLIQLGRRQGGLEIEDIRQALPIDTMTIEELADVVARLEEAGISVEIDAALLTPRHQKMALPKVKPTPEPSRDSERTMTGHPRLLNLNLASSIKAARENSSRIRGSTHPYVQKSATIFVLVAALILFLIALGVWRFA
jgi:MFS superfamily sulfate permease-like transporter